MSEQQHPNPEDVIAEWSAALPTTAYEMLSDNAVAISVLKALAAAGLKVVPVIPTPDPIVEQSELVSTVVPGSYGDLNVYGPGRCGHLAPYPGCAKCNRYR